MSYSSSAPQVHAEPLAAGGERKHQTRRDVRAPALFVSFGSPLALRDPAYQQALRRFGIALRPPKGILVLTSNWKTMRPLRVTASRHPGHLHDYGDFPRWLEKVSYPCPGSPVLAADAVAALGSVGIPAILDMQQGFDHTAWMPVSLLYPNHRVPLAQVSLPAAGTPEDMLAIGAALACLRRKGYLLLGVGGTVFNPHRARYDRIDAPAEPWAISFDGWVRDRLEALDTASLVNYRRLGPQAHLAAPTSDSLDPLFAVMGAQLQGDLVRQVYEGFHAASLSLRCFVVAGRRKDDLRLPDALVGAQ
jgi:4,5-DOPA dioxygenase extradiol